MTSLKIHRIVRALLCLFTLHLAWHARTAQAARANGIDVSSYQGGSINWASVKAGGYSFAWAKATESVTLTDSTYAGNVSRGKAAGVYMGGYDFTHPNVNTPTAEAAYFWGVTKANTLADGLSLNPMLDMEVFSGVTGAASYSAWVNAWCNTIVQDAVNQSVSITPAIYLSACHANQMNSSVAQWGVDVANYSGNDSQTSTPWTACSGYNVWGSWDFWQYSSTLSVPGIADGTVDHDVYNGTAAQVLANQVATGLINTNVAIFYWDAQKNAAGTPYTGSMSGVWESNLWSTGNTGLASPVAFLNTKAACFGVHTGISTPAYTVTMNKGHLVAGFFNGALSPAASDVTIAGTGQINLAAGDQALDTIKSSDGFVGKTRIDVGITGSGKLFPEGNGLNYLHGTNTYEGGTQLGYLGNPFSGSIYFNNDSAFGTGTITLWTNGNGSSLILEGTTGVNITNDVTVISTTTNHIVGNSAGLTFSGDWNLGAAFRIGTGASATGKTILAGTVKGSGALTITNKGALVLTGTNTFTGTVTILSPAIFTVDGAGLLGSGTYAKNIANAGTFNYSSSAAQTLSGVLSGAGPLNVSDGVLTLTGVNTYTGATTVGAGGAVGLNAETGLGSSASFTLNGGGLKNNNALTVSTARPITLGVNGGFLDAGTNAAKPLTVAAKISGSGSLAINQDASSVILLNVTNNYTGDTIIGTNGPGSDTNGATATLKLGAAGVIPTGSGVGNIYINGAYQGVLDLAGFNQTINGLNGDGTVTNSTGTSSLTIGNNNASGVFNGTIQDPAGTITVTKIGSGTLTLGGSNTFTGNMALTAGTLALGSSGSLNGTTLSLTPGTAFDLSAKTAYTLSATLSVTSSITPAIFVAGTNVDLNSVVVAYDGITPALAVTSGNLVLAGSTFTINGAALPVGIYPLMQTNGGNISIDGPCAINGTAISTPGTVGALAVSGGNLVVVVGYATTTTLAPLTNSFYRDPVTFTATVTPAATGGTVQFFDAMTTLGDPAPVTNGIASYTTTLLSLGNHPITAAFSGLDNYVPSFTATSSVQQILVPTNMVPPILLAGNGTSTAFQTNGAFSLSLTGTPGWTYLIQGADDLTAPVQWMTLSTNTADTNGVVNFSDTTATNFNSRYYRTVLY